MNQKAGHAEWANLNLERQYDLADVGVLDGLAEAELQGDDWDASHLPDFVTL